MEWKRMGFFKRSVKPEQTTTFIEGESEMLEEEHDPNDCVEDPIDHAKLFFDNVFGSADDENKVAIEKWFEHLKKENNLTTQEVLVNHIWVMAGKPTMREPPTNRLFSTLWLEAHYATMAIWGYYNEWYDEVAKNVVFQKLGGEWFVTADHHQFPVQFGDHPKNHDIIPEPFYNFKNGKAIMHMRTNEGIVSMVIGTDYRIKTALNEKGNYVETFTVDRSGNVCDLLVITTTLSDLLRENKRV